MLGGVEVNETSTLADVRVTISDDEIPGVPPSYLFLFGGAPVTRRQEGRRRAVDCFPRLAIIRRALVGKRGKNEKDTKDDAKVPAQKEAKEKEKDVDPEPKKKRKNRSPSRKRPKRSGRPRSRSKIRKQQAARSVSARKGKRSRTRSKERKPREDRRWKRRSPNVRKVWSRSPLRCSVSRKRKDSAPPLPPAPASDVNAKEKEKDKRASTWSSGGGVLTGAGRDALRSAASMRRAAPAGECARLIHRRKSAVLRETRQQWTRRRPQEGAFDDIDNHTSLIKLRMLVSAVQAGGEYRASALKRLAILLQGLYANRWPNFLVWMLRDRSKVEHFWRWFDETSRFILLFLEDVCGDGRLGFCTVVACRLALVDPGPVKAALGQLRKGLAAGPLRPGAFSQAVRQGQSFRSGGSDPRGDAYKPWGRRITAAEQEGKVSALLEKLEVLLQTGAPLPYGKLDLEELVGMRVHSDTLACQFSLMQVGMDLIYSRAHRARMWPLRKLLYVGGSGCLAEMCGSTARVIAWTRGMQRQSQMRRLLTGRASLFGFKLIDWFFLCEHSSCAIRKYISQCPEPYGTTDLPANWRQLLADRYTDESKEQQYRRVIRIISSMPSSSCARARPLARGQLRT